MKLPRITTAFVALLSLSAPAFSASADDYTGEKTLGLQAGYIDYNKSALAGVEFTYRFNRHLRLAPNASYVFRNNNVDALMLNLNVHVPFPLGAKWEIFPFAGLNYSSWNYHYGEEPEIEAEDVGNRVSRFGLNLGGGGTFCVTKTLNFGLQASYVFIKHFDGFNVVAKIAYRF